MNYYGVQWILDDEKIGISDRITNGINERGRKRCINYQKIRITGQIIRL